MVQAPKGTQPENPQFCFQLLCGFLACFPSLKDSNSSLHNQDDSYSYLECGREQGASRAHGVQYFQPFRKEEEFCWGPTVLGPLGRDADRQFLIQIWVPHQNYCFWTWLFILWIAAVGPYWWYWSLFLWKPKQDINTVLTYPAPKALVLVVSWCCHTAFLNKTYT